MSGRDIAQRRMATLSIVEGFVVKENVRVSLRSGLVDHMMYPFHFQAAKEPLSWGIVVAVAPRTYTHLKTLILQSLLIDASRISTAPI